ncbi:MAG: type II toxin-antitoxin system VapC family toxin [Planctomycetaceae bacterium]
MKILLDTNVVLRIGQVTHPQHSLVMMAIEQLDVANHEACIVPQVLYEYWVVATRPVDVNGFGMDAQTADSSLEQFTRDVTLLRDVRGVFDRWRSLVTAHQILGKTAHDARLVAAMLRHGMSHLLTFNFKDFTRYPGITALDPAAVAAGQVPL